MQQGRGVDEFDRGGQLVVTIPSYPISAAPASVSIGRMRLPPPATRCPASAGISGIRDCILSRITAFTLFMPSATSAMSGANEGSTLRGAYGGVQSSLPAWRLGHGLASRKLRGSDKTVI
jgi:hypothetical protein